MRCRERAPSAVSVSLARQQPRRAFGSGADPKVPANGRLFVDGQVLTDKAYADDRTRQLVAECGYVAVVPPKSNRKEPWDYDEEIYQRRNEVVRMFRLMKEQLRVATRFDKLDVTYLSFVYLAFVRIALKDAMGA